MTVSTTEPPLPSSSSLPSAASRSLTLSVNGDAVEVPDVGESLLAVLRDRLGILSVKDGCSPQGQCGCCTVLVDGKARVACVTPARRVRGRDIRTVEGMDPERSERWGSALCAAGGSQCGFCTPGIVMRLDAVAAEQESAAPAAAKDSVDQALLAHLCRCTGWQTIHEAWGLFVGDGPIPVDANRDLGDASRRASIEGRAEQVVSPLVALGQGGFAADTAPKDCLIAVSNGAGGWIVGETLTDARAASGKVQGRRTTATHRHPLEIPPGEWAATLRTTWVDGAYLETDASWCRPGGDPVSTVANGGAFGAKQERETDRGNDTEQTQQALDVRGAAAALAAEHDRPVLVLASREDVAVGAPKRPPVAGGMKADCTGVLRVVATPGLAEAVAAVAPGLTVEEVRVPGPPTSVALRAAGWAEAVVLSAGATGELTPVHALDGGVAEAVIEGGTGFSDAEKVIKVVVGCGRVLDPVVLRSYCIGAAHMAWSWLTSEAMLVDEVGTVHDLTIRSFGVLRAMDTPKIEVEIIPGEGEPVNGSDAVFAAVAAAGWLANDCPPEWPIASSNR